LCVQPELHRHFLDRVNGRAINIGLASLTQSSIADWDAEAFEHAFQRCRTTVHGGCLYDFGDNQTGMLVRNLHGCPLLSGKNRKRSPATLRIGRPYASPVALVRSLLL